MTIMRSLFEGRAIDASQFNKALFADPVTHAGVTVNQDQALRLIAVNRCVRLQAETVASLPMDRLRRQPDGTRETLPKTTWMEEPNPETSWFNFVEKVVTSHQLDGNAFIYTAGYDELSLPKELWVLDPRKVEIKREENTGGIYYLYDGTERLTPYRRNAARRGDVLHVPAFSAPNSIRGLSPIDMARQGIALGLVTEKFGARFFGSGQTPSGVIEIPRETKADQGVIDRLKANWTAHHAGSSQSHLPGVLVGGAQWKPITISPEHAQFLETRKFQVTEIARLFGVPPHLVGDVEKSTSWGTGIEEQNRQWLNVSLMPQIVRVEEALNQFLPRGQYAKFNLAAFLRADTKSRYDAYGVLLDRGVIAGNEVRALEDWNPIEGLDEPRVPLNTGPLSEQGEPDGA